MPRARNPVQGRQRHKKVLKQARGYKGARSRTFRVANQAVIRASQYAYRDRRRKKRDFRRLWIVRINAACRARGVMYSRFMQALKAANIQLDRRALASLAMEQPLAFDALLAQVGFAVAESEAKPPAESS